MSNGSDMKLDALTAVSPIDGRYAGKCTELREVFSEYGLVKRRVLVECAWLEAMCGAKEIRECKALSAAERKALRAIASGFSVEDARRVKEIERTTNHDVKAVEYFLKEKVKGTSLESRSEFIHCAHAARWATHPSRRDGCRGGNVGEDGQGERRRPDAGAYARPAGVAYDRGQGARRGRCASQASGI